MPDATFQSSKPPTGGGQGGGTKGPSALAQALTDLSSADSQKVFQQLGDSLRASAPDQQTLSDIDQNLAEIDKIMSQVQDRDQKIKAIDDQLDASRQRSQALDRQIAAIEGRITVHSDKDIRDLTGLSLLDEEDKK